MDIFSYLLGKKASGGGGTGRDWSTIGYSGEPKEIVDGYNYAKLLYDNWDATQTSLENKYQNDIDLVYFPAVDLSKVTTLKNAFNGCTRLVTFPTNVDLAKVTSLHYAFKDCKALKEININTNKATVLTAMFNGCTSLQKVVELDLTNAEYCTDVFSGCTNLTTITIKPPTKTLNTLDLGTMFMSCKSLVTAPSFDTSKITTMLNMFNGCSVLTNVPVYNLSGIKEKSGTATYNNSPIYMFGYCKNLSNESLNNIMASAKTATNLTASAHKTLKSLGLTADQANICITLSNWSDLEEAGWTTGF